MSETQTTYTVNIRFRKSAHHAPVVAEHSTMADADKFATTYLNENGWRGAVGYTISHDGRVQVTGR
jgi:hypothetical protein